MSGADLPAATVRVRRFFETLTVDSVAELAHIYAPDAYFKDPFNEVRGLPQIERIFRHMFVQVKDPRFVIHQAVIGDGHVFLVWDFQFEMRRFSAGQQVVRGASHLQFDSAGRVAFHRDYWDAAEELYEKLPVLGGLMRWLKRRAAQ